MNSINPHTHPAKPDIDHPSLFKEGARVVKTKPPLLARDVNHTTSQNPHWGRSRNLTKTATKHNNCSTLPLSKPMFPEIITFAAQTFNRI
jgi:hypothetical protein